MKVNFSKAYLTGFYTGLIPFAPGTFGSLLAFPLSYLIVLISAKLELRISIAAIEREVQEILALCLVFIFVIIAIFISGKYYSDIYIKNTGREDPKEIVIDEIGGQLLTIFLSSINVVFISHSEFGKKLSPEMVEFLFIFLMPFSLFRLFDIIKPWPINIIDKKLKNGLGLMLDDYVAAIFAALMSYAITLILTGDLSNAN